MKEEIGRICVKTVGREAGRKCVVVDVLDKKFVRITGPKNMTGVRRRRANVSHLSFTPQKIKIKGNEADEGVLKALEKAGLNDYMREMIKISPAQALGVT